MFGTCACVHIESHYSLHCNVRDNGHGNCKVQQNNAVRLGDTPHEMACHFITNIDEHTRECACKHLPKIKVCACIACHFPMNEAMPCEIGFYSDNQVHFKGKSDREFRIWIEELTGFLDWTG